MAKDVSLILLSENTFSTFFQTNNTFDVYNVAQSVEGEVEGSQLEPKCGKNMDGFLVS